MTDQVTNWIDQAHALEHELAQVWLSHRDQMRAEALSAPARFVDFDSHRLSQESVRSPWLFAFRLQVDDDVRESINLLNRFAHSNLGLKAWGPTLEQCRDGLRPYVLGEFIWPLAIEALNTPYRFKQTLIFTLLAALDVRHHSGAPFEERGASMDLLERAVSRREDSNPLLTALHAVDADAYRAATSDFRNRYHHRRAPNVAMGVRTVVNRFSGPEGTGIGFGLAQPLSLEGLVPGLAAEHERTIAALETAWEFLCLLDRELHEQEELPPTQP